MLCSRLGFPTPSPTPARNPNQGLFDKFPELGHDYRRADNGEFEVDEKLVNELLAKRLHARLGLALTLALALALTLALALALALTLALTLTLTRLARDFVVADNIRGELRKMGVEVG